MSLEAWGDDGMDGLDWADILEKRGWISDASGEYWARVEGDPFIPFADAIEIESQRDEEP